MVPGSSVGPNGDSQPSIDSTVDEEVTRVEAVRYLEGASGHGVLSLGFLLAGGTLVKFGAWGAGLMAVVVAYGVALNGLSIYAWDHLRVYFASVVGRSDDPEPSRALTPHRISTEMKAELLTGFTMVGGFVVALGGAVRALQAVGTRVGLYLSVVALAVADVGALLWTFYTRPIQ